MRAFPGWSSSSGLETSPAAAAPGVGVGVRVALAAEGAGEAQVGVPRRPQSASSMSEVMGDSATVERGLWGRSPRRRGPRMSLWSAPSALGAALARRDRSSLRFSSALKVAARTMAATRVGEWRLKVRRG